jgi:hypothetical protein
MFLFQTNISSEDCKPNLYLRFMRDIQRTPAAGASIETLVTKQCTQSGHYSNSIDRNVSNTAKSWTIRFRISYSEVLKLDWRYWQSIHLGDNHSFYCYTAISNSDETTTLRRVWMWIGFFAEASKLITRPLDSADPWWPTRSEIIPYLYNHRKRYPMATRHISQYADDRAQRGLARYPRNLVLTSSAVLIRLSVPGCFWTSYDMSSSHWLRNTECLQTTFDRIMTKIVDQERIVNRPCLGNSSSGLDQPFSSVLRLHR